MKTEFESRLYMKLRNIFEEEIRKYLEANPAALEKLIDCLYGADPDELYTKERSAWKTSVTKRIKKIRENHPEESVRNDYRVIFGRLYDSLQRDYAVDLNAEKEAYMDRYSIPHTAYRNVRTLNVVYDNIEFRRYFEDEVEKFEGRFIKD